MSDRGLAILRWTMVGVFAAVTWDVSHDGSTPGELVFLTVLAAVFVVAIVSVDWINRAERRPDETRRWSDGDV